MMQTNSRIWKYVLRKSLFAIAVLTLVLEILAMLLRNGRSHSGKVILAPATVEAMFTNQLAWLPKFARSHLTAVKPELVYVAEGFYPPCPPPTPQGWGLGFMITPGPTGRSEMTGHWYGLSNAFW